MDEKTLILNDEARWQAVEQRDPGADGSFVYAVRSTGIYCRPTCPSRRPRRAQVTFFADPKSAEAAGFRACRRCRPLDALRPAAEMAEQARRLIEEAETLPTLSALSERMAVSPYHLQRTFKAVTGLTPRQYAAALRAERLKAGLRPPADDASAPATVTGAAYTAGFASSSRLYEAAGGALGMSPGQYQKGGAGMDIHYTLIETTLGCLLLAATQRGICAVQFGESPAALQTTLAAEFPRARITRDDAALAGWSAALQASLAGAADAASNSVSLPLDVQGTAFQQRVWAELRGIPRGQTRTYTQVAQAIGQPSAVRAVARACATNPAALVIPCHRVVRAGGALAGYRWGIERKRALLEKEQQ